jgi:hypothetical protein
METFWYRERIILLMAGVFNLIGLSLSYFVSPYFLILCVLVGLNLTIYSLTGFCVMGTILYKLGIKSQKECSI